MSHAFPDLVCTCGTTYEVAQAPPLCPCGGMYSLAENLGYRPKEGSSMWGYPLPASTVALDIGQGRTPVEKLADNLIVTRDDLNPTGSFKARGAAVLISLAQHLGVDHVCVDSSGNAGPAVAACAQLAGIATTVVLPESTDPAKIANAEKYGATVVRIPGDRTASMMAVRDVIANGAFYASHIYHPYFFEGVRTYVFDVYEAGYQPEEFIVPVGNGTLVLGCMRAFEDLRHAGVIRELPRLTAVQAAECSPLVGGPRGSTIAGGIAIPDPPRAAEIHACVESTGGQIVTVSEAEIREAVRDLGERGIGVEPTSATGWAVALRHERGGLTHVHLGGCAKTIEKEDAGLRR